MNRLEPQPRPGSTSVVPSPERSGALPLPPTRPPLLESQLQLYSSSSSSSSGPERTVPPGFASSGRQAPSPLSSSPPESQVWGTGTGTGTGSSERTLPPQLGSSTSANGPSGPPGFASEPPLHTGSSWPYPERTRPPDRTRPDPRTNMNGYRPSPRHPQQHQRPPNMDMYQNQQHQRPPPRHERPPNLHDYDRNDDDEANDAYGSPVQLPPRQQQLQGQEQQIIHRKCEATRIDLLNCQQQNGCNVNADHDDGATTTTMEANVDHQQQQVQQLIQNYQQKQPQQQQQHADCRQINHIIATESTDPTMILKALDLDHITMEMLEGGGIPTSNSNSNSMMMDHNYVGGAGAYPPSSCDPLLPFVCTHLLDLHDCCHKCQQQTDDWMRHCVFEEIIFRRPGACPGDFAVCGQQSTTTTTPTIAPTQPPQKPEQSQQPQTNNTTTGTNGTTIDTSASGDTTRVSANNNNTGGKDNAWVFYCAMAVLPILACLLLRLGMAGGRRKRGPRKRTPSAKQQSLDNNSFTTHQDDDDDGGSSDCEHIMLDRREPEPQHEEDLHV